MKQTSQLLGLIVPQKYAHVDDTREVGFLNSKIYLGDEQKIWSFETVAISAAS
jgi:hypothetical protein